MLRFMRDQWAALTAWSILHWGAETARLVRVYSGSICERRKPSQRKIPNARAGALR